MELILFIIIISVITSNIKKNQPNEYAQARQKAKEIKDEWLGEFRGIMHTRKDAYEKQWGNYGPIFKSKSSVKEPEPERRPLYESTMETRTTSILERAKENVEADKEDETLRSLERSHGHSARVTPAVHSHPEVNLSESSLGTVEDLMVKGYEGNLCFERDFLGEAMDMVSRFSLGGSVNHES